MKVFFSVLFFATTLLGHVHPYFHNMYRTPPRRPHQQLRRPVQQQIHSHELPAHLTISQLITLTEQLSAKLRSQVQMRPPSTSYGVPENNGRIVNYPQGVQSVANTYGAPPTTNLLETFDKLRLGDRYLQNQNVPAFPARDFNNGWRVTGHEDKSKLVEALAGQYLPVKEATDFGKVASGNNQRVPHETYSVPVPPTTPRTVAEDNPSVTTTESTRNENVPETEEEPSPVDEETENPNVAIATAVAGGSGVFYLQQPDGRLQRVIFQRTMDESDRANEYTANYHFQNIQAVPNTLYSPLITLG